MASDVKQKCKCVDWRMKTIEYLCKMIDAYDSEIQDAINKLNKKGLCASAVHYESHVIFDKSYAIIELKHLIYELEQELGDVYG